MRVGDFVKTIRESEGVYDSSGILTFIGLGFIGRIEDIAETVTGKDILVSFNGNKYWMYHGALAVTTTLDEMADL